jgi:hypothetical protein
VRANTCTVNLDGTKIECHLPEGCMLRVEPLKARQPIIELRGILAKAQVSRAEGNRPKQLASPKKSWARYSLEPGSKLKIVNLAEASVIQITQESRQEPQPAIRLKLIMLPRNDGN